ncbi:MAG TPA: glycosyl transferase [Bacteroidales bacterium]|nr:glycosyl transferase [Bacteroidales bacterium]
MNSLQPKVSIITVVYNSEIYIERTLKSILNQTFTNFEYLVIDGKSTDKTLDIVKSYSQLNPIILSEKDNGLYDAMNKGLKLATGEFVWFMNSGDEIASSDTLAQIFAIETANKADLIYGETLITDQQGDTIGLRRLKTPKKLTRNSFKKGMLISHQSVLVRKNIAPNFNLKYRYSSDYNWLMEVIFNTTKYYNTEIILSKFMDGGQTKKTIIPGLKERFNIMTNYYGLISTMLMHIPIAFKFLNFYKKNKRF